MLHIEILRPDKVVHRGKADLIILPGKAGKFGVMSGHMNMMTTLTSRFISVDSTVFNCNGGFCQVTQIGDYTECKVLL